jgi:hypothetical protein
MSNHILPFVDVVKALRAEIVKAIKEKNDEIRFGVGAIEVEFHVVAKREGGTDAKIKFGVFGLGAEIGAGGKFATEHVQKVKLTLKPVRTRADGSDAQVEIAKMPARGRKISRS